LAAGGVLARGTLYRFFEVRLPSLLLLTPARPPSRRALGVSGGQRGGQRSGKLKNI